MESIFSAVSWGMACDAAAEDPADAEKAREKELLLWTLHFTTQLIEHSFSRHLYSSMEHLTALLASSDLGKLVQHHTFCNFLLAYFNPSLHGIQQHLLRVGRHH